MCLYVADVITCKQRCCKTATLFRISSGVLYLLGKVFLQWSVKVLYCSLYNGFLYDSMKFHMFTCTCTSKMLPAVYQNARIKLTH